MGHTILFSAVGTTDPMRNEHDGSMLHICRNYRPDVVYLYMSAEMLDYHLKDNRYVKAIQLLGEFLNHQFEVHVLKRPELTNPQDYDYCYGDFSKVLNQISEGTEEGDVLLVNCASGTPAMKSALTLIPILSKYKIHPIQVNSPEGRANRSTPEHEGYDVDLYWEFNVDNEEGTFNRCREIQQGNLVKQLKLDMIKKHIRVYDYHAAYQIGKELHHQGDFVSDKEKELLELLEIGNERMRLNATQISKLGGDKKYNIYPLKSSGEQVIFEYALYLQIKLDRKEYADFIRGITPIGVDLLKRILKTRCNVNISECVSTDKGSSVEMWDANKLHVFMDGRILEILNHAYKGGFKMGVVYSNHLENLIEMLCADDSLKEIVKKFSLIEKKFRNSAAHEILSITENTFQYEDKKMGIKISSPNEIMRIIRSMVAMAGIKATEEAWKSYDTMNKMILERIN